MLKTAIIAIFISVLSTGAFAACPAYTYTFTNGTTADASQVNANFTTVMNCANSIVTVLRGYISGAQLSAVGGTNTFSIASGVAADTTASAQMTLASGYTKTTATWAVGTGNGALDTGSIANNTWYHVYLIERIDTGVVDILFSLSATSPTLPTSYSLFRRIGSVATDGSAHIRAFVQYGDEFIWTGALQNVSIGTATSRSLVTLDVPTGVKVRAKLQGYAQDAVSNTGSNIFIQDPDMTGGSFGIGSMQTSFPVVGVDNVTRTNTSAQVYLWIQTSAPFPLVRLDMPGWFDDRGKN